MLKVDLPSSYPSIINNRSLVSFIIFNVPDNETLNTSHYDTDEDGLTDWTELYRTFTSPFLVDTDSDSVNDYYEHIGGSDPNDYTDTLLPGDFDYTCNVDLSDFTIFSYSWLKSEGEPGWNSLCDFDSSGEVDFIDFIIFTYYYGTSCE